MKRRDLIRHLENNGCEFLREGGNHTIYVNRRAQKSSAIPRHREIIDFLAKRFAKTSTFRSREFPQRTFLSRRSFSEGGCSMCGPHFCSMNGADGDRAT
jgi:hypothetical protein